MLYAMYNDASGTVSQSIFTRADSATAKQVFLFSQESACMPQLEVGAGVVAPPGGLTGVKLAPMRFLVSFLPGGRTT